MKWTLKEFERFMCTLKQGDKLCICYRQFGDKLPCRGIFVFDKWDIIEKHIILTGAFTGNAIWYRRITDIYKITDDETTWANHAKARKTP